MKRNSPSKVCGYVLERKPEVVQKLERGNDLFVLLGDSEALKLLKVCLIVPARINVYRVKSNLREGGELVFTCPSEDQTEQAYLSEVTLNGEGTLNYMRNVGVLGRYQWFDARSSDLVFQRLVEGWAYQTTSTKGFHLFSNCVAGQGRHPLLGQG
ncbi:MAG: hypothetical protein AABW80_03405 [Nanoarchaeota archaeon]